MPGVFLEDPDFYSIDELDCVYPISKKERAIINVGSVGQPRDQDTRSGYVVVKDDKVQFVRVEYDLEKTIATIIANPALDDFEAARPARRAIDSFSPAISFLTKQSLTQASPKKINRTES